MSKAKLVAQWIDVLNKRIGENIGLILLPLMCISLMEVILRYVFNRPTIWAWDVNIQLHAVLISVAGGYVLLSGRFVVVDVFISRLSPKARARLDLITSVVIFFAIGILIWQGTKGAWHSWTLKECFTSNWMPVLYPLRFIVLIGFILLFLQIVSRFIRNLLVAMGREEGAGP